MDPDATPPELLTGHGGHHVVAALSAHGVSELFTLSGGHVFPIYDAAVSAGLPIFDVRHEQTATFAAEGVAKLRARPGVAVLTAGPGVTNGISAMTSQNSYRGLVRMNPGASGARNFTQCDSLLIGDRCGAHTFPYIESKNPSAIVEHEATTSKVSDDQMFLCQQRGIDPEKAVSMIVNGFCKEVFKELPMEFAVEAGKLLEVSLEGAVG